MSRAKYLYLAHVRVSAVLVVGQNGKLHAVRLQIVPVATHAFHGRPWIFTCWQVCMGPKQPTLQQSGQLIMPGSTVQECVVNCVALGGVTHDE